MGARTAVGFVRVVLAVIVSITDVGRVSADAGATLKLARSALELSCRENTQHVINHDKQLIFNSKYYSLAALITHGTARARLSGPHSRPRCRTSTRTGCICRFCKQTEGKRRFSL